MISTPISCELSEDYPEVQVEGKNLCYANILSNDFAGMVSEETAINQYVYQHIILYKDYPALADTLECISIVEMRHLEILGKLIYLLGSTPKIGASSNLMTYFWSGRFLNYEKSPKFILKNNIMNEQQAINNYKKRLLQIKDCHINEIISRIIKDEEYHITIFKKILDSIN